MTRKSSGANQKYKTNHDDAGNEHPSAFRKVHAGIEQLDKGNKHHHIFEGLLSANAQQKDEHNGKRRIARCKVASVDVDSPVDLIMRRNQHPWMDQRKKCANNKQKRA
jgi:hypothetical protein